MKTNPVVWFEIYAQDMGCAKKFYESVFQVELERLNSPDLEMWSFPMVMDLMGAWGALVTMEDFSSGGNCTRVYCGCADCAVEVARIGAFMG